MDVLMQFGRKCDHTLWNNWVVFSNGWLYDSVNNSWWQLLDNLFTGTASRRIQWLAAGKGSAQYLWCVGGSGKNSNSDPNIEYVRYDRSTQGQSYTWISQPLPVSLMQTIDVHEIEIGITNVSPNTQLLIQLDTIDGTTSSSEPVIIHNGSSRPIRVRLPIGIRGNSITVTYSVSGPGPAPTTNEIIVGYMEAGPYGQAPGQEP
jgi:hypothetical protein